MDPTINFITNKYNLICKVKTYQSNCISKWRRIHKDTRIINFSYKESDICEEKKY